MTIDDISYIDIETINGLNLYAYCGNNPVMNIDTDGNFFITFLLVSIGVGVFIGGTVAGVTAYNNGARGWDLVGSIVGGAILGGAMGAIMAIGGAAGMGVIGVTSFGALGISAAIGVGAGLLAYTAETLISPSRQWSWKEFAWNGVSGLVKGIVTYGIAYAGGKFGASDKLFLKELLGKKVVKDVFAYDFAKAMLASIIPSAGRQFFTHMSHYLGEGLVRLLLVSSVAAVARWGIDKIFGT